MTKKRTGIGDWHPLGGEPEGTQVETTAAPKAARKAKTTAPATEPHEGEREAQEAALQRQVAYGEELISFSARIPRRLSEGMEDLKLLVNRAATSKDQKRTIAELTAEAIAAFLKSNPYRKS